ncbi:MAG: MMPL family transporter [Bacteroidales bacterium]|nr:MMPL family transporter [Bacteroidales bacterium]
MEKYFLLFHDWVQCHRRMALAALTLFLAVCVALVARLDFKEDITDFLPVDEHYRRSMQVYQEVASANKIVLQFRSDEGMDSIIAGVERFGAELPKHDTIGWVRAFEPQMDMTVALDVAEFVYSHLPYLLDVADYARMDSLLADADFAPRRLAWIEQQLTSMTGSFMQPMLQLDPMGMGNRVAAHLRDFQPEMSWVQHDGYLFTADSACCLVTIDSPFGSSESDMNGRLVEMLNSVADASLPDGVTMRPTGAPVIAAGNATQIRRDTVLSLSVSVVLILALLLWAFRSLRSLWYIVLSTSFGFLVALAAVSLMGQSLSLIVLGIASIIVGIAVNYPLHFACHSQEVGEGRRTLAELIKPLLVGNVTTVAAFLTLVPLKADAIRQLGLFSALMLVGTILFVLVVMPHLRPVKGRVMADGAALADTRKRIVGEAVVKSPLSLIIIVLLTAFFGWFSLRTTFDSDVSHLNFMTDEQRADMAQLASMQGQSDGVTVYLPATQTAMEAMRPTLDSLWRAGEILAEKNASFLFPSAEKQCERLQLWHDFWQTHNYHIFLSQARDAGFSEEAFEPFQLMVEMEHKPLAYSDFEPLTSTVLTGYVSPDALVTRLIVADADAAARVESVLPGSFDLTSLNSRVASALTDNFNYIGLACACIVFLFLWLSFGRWQLAVIAFTPMAVGWIWILGLMQLLGIQFNIVNIILATFIFGQGDDYTIFITEGLLRDYREGTGRRTLIGYQRSILLSAAIMLVGIGSLILAKHPAMHSLAEVTIIGMAVVVLMAWLLPPMIFHWLLKIKILNNKY